MLKLIAYKHGIEQMIKAMKQKFVSLIGSILIGILKSLIARI